jgi:predicted O-methyltransferase YrrM
MSESCPVRGHRRPFVARYDYEPPGLRRYRRSTLPDPFPIRRFEIPYLRREAPHIWRIDARSKDIVGVLSREEALILHNLALPLTGRRALEIGSYIGWSTAHLLAAGLKLDVVDPRFAEPANFADVDATLRRVEGRGSFRLIAGFSPAIIPPLAPTAPGGYSFVFIDGNHDGEAPTRDAEAVIEFCDKDACVVFHDLTAPSVSGGLRFFHERGWKTRIYNTMQVMGAAWRGEYRPVDHIADERMPAIKAEHLVGMGND